MLRFPVRSLHAAQTPVELCLARFRKRSVDQQPVARLCYSSALHEAEVVARAASPSLPAAGSEAGALPTPTPVSPFPLLPSLHTAVFGASSSMLRFAPLSSHATQTSVWCSALSSMSAASVAISSVAVPTSSVNLESPASLSLSWSSCRSSSRCRSALSCRSAQSCRSLRACLN